MIIMSRTFVMLFFIFGICCPNKAIALHDEKGRDIAITGVNIIDATGRPLKANMTVLISEGVIIEIGETSKTTVPEGYFEIKAMGTYLIPGLWDAHVHLSKMRASSMNLLIANGVTSVRDMGGDHEELLGWRNEIRAGQRVGPRIFMAGPYLESKENIDRQRNDPASERIEPVERTRIPVGSPEDAKEIIACLAKTEIDFFKIRTVENKETLQAIGDAAKKHGLDLYGHVTFLTPEQIMKTGFISIEHMLYPTLDKITSDARKNIWAKMRDAGVYMAPTLAAFHAGMFSSDEDIENLFNNSEATPIEMDYLSKFLYLDWVEQASERSSEQLGFFTQIYEAMLVNWKEMLEVGINAPGGNPKCHHYPRFYVGAGGEIGHH